MLFLLSYFLILLGSTTVTLAILGKFTYRKRTIIELNRAQRVLAALIGVLVLLGSVLLNAYANEASSALQAVSAWL